MDFDVAPPVRAALLEAIDREGFGYVAADTSELTTDFGRSRHAVTITSASKAWNIAGLKCAQVVATNHADAKRWRNLPAELPEVTHHAPEATFLAGLDCAALGLDDPARFFLDHAHVALSNGPPFRLGNEQHVRLNFATSRALLEQIVHALGAAGRSRC
jgi:cystathionine beta-lyase